MAFGEEDPESLRGKIRALLKERGEPMSPVEVAEILGISKTVAQTRCLQLYQQGWLDRPSRGRYVYPPEE